MTLTIPYSHSAIQIDTTMNGSLGITFSQANEVSKLVFDQLLYNMSYDDIINIITPQSFEQIIEHYNTNYKEDL